MCGIVGIIGKNQNFIKNSLKLLKHRGPDDFGVFISEKLSLGHVRLSIQDISKAGHQPMFYDNKNLIIVFNGEIYNFLELKKKLVLKGYKFKTKTDTEVILASYLEWGEDCVKKFRGMWAFSIYDKKKEILFLSRDRFGKKPLYIYDFDGFFAFSSELKCFISEKKFKLSISKEDLYHYLAFKYVRPNKSIFKEVFKLEPGHNLIYNIKNNSYFKKKYFKINSRKKYSKNFFNTFFEKEFENSIKERLLSDVPVGAFLSGGVDSSAVVAFMSKYKKKIKTFSVGFDYKKYNESSYAKKVAKIYKTDHYEVKFNYKDVEKLIYELPYYYDEPFGDSSQLPTFLVSKVASKHVKVVLGGDGADEIFGGYHRYLFFRFLYFQKFIPLFLRRKLKFFLENRDIKLTQKISKVIILSQENLTKELYKQIIISVPEIQLKKLFKINGNINLNLNNFPTDINFSKNIQFYDFNSYLLEDNLVKIDRSSMANSIEIRSPFLSTNLVELGLNLNNFSKFNFFEGKYILKRFLKKYLPNEILFRKKKGFGVPISEYFKKELKHLVVEKILNFNLHNYFDKKEIQKICTEHFTGEKNNSVILWNILMFNLWFEKWGKKRF